MKELKLKSRHVEILNLYHVENNVMTSTDLEIFRQEKTSLENGMYGKIGADYIKTEDKIEDCPPMPKKAEFVKSLTLPFSHWQTLATFASDDDMHPVAQYVYDYGDAVMSTDGYRLAYYPIDKNIGGSLVMIPKKLIKLFSKKDVLRLDLYKSSNEKYMFFEIHNTPFFGSYRLTENTIKAAVDLKKFLTTEQPQNTLTFDPKELADALKVLKPYYSKYSNVVNFSSNGGSVYVSENKAYGLPEKRIQLTPQPKEAFYIRSAQTVVMPISPKGHTSEDLCMNARLLLDILKANENKTISFHFDSNKMPVFSNI